MSTRTVEIEDSLQERIDSAIEDVKQELIDYLESNPDKDETPDLGNDLDYSGAIHEIIDSSVPIYTGEINDTWYLYGSECEEAFDYAGIGEKVDANWPCGDWRMPAIYCYIEQKVSEWYHNEAEGVFEQWRSEHESESENEDENGESGPDAGVEVNG